MQFNFVYKLGKFPIIKYFTYNKLWFYIFRTKYFNTFKCLITESDNDKKLKK